MCWIWLDYHRIINVYVLYLGNYLDTYLSTTLYLLIYVQEAASLNTKQLHLSHVCVWGLQPRRAVAGGGEGEGRLGGGGVVTAADLNMEQSSLWCYNKELRTCKFLFDISSSSLYLKKRSKILYILVVDNCNGPLSSSDAFSQQKEISINKQSCLDDWRLLCWPGGGRGRGRGGAAAV